MEKIEFKTDGDSNFIEVKGKLSVGKVYAILNALEKSESPVASEVYKMCSESIKEESKKNPEAVFNRVRRFSN